MADVEQIEAYFDSLGMATCGDLVTVIVDDRETYDPDDALAAAQQIDWGLVWDEVVGPALDRIEDILEAHGAVRNLYGTDEPVEDEPMDMSGSTPGVER